MALHAPRERKEEEKIMIEFFMAMIPPTVTHQEKNIKVINGKPIVYEPEELKSARRKLIGHLAEHVPERKSNKPLRLIVKWCYPLRQQKRDGQYKNTKPDLDNAQKLLQDCMTYVGFWKDDAQIASLVCEKFWSKIPGIYIRIEELSSKIKTCGNCKHYEDFNGVCCNGLSEHRADFMNDTDSCLQWEGRYEEKNEEK